MNPPKFEILSYEPTPLGILCLRRRELLMDRGQLVTEVTLNGEFLMSSLNTKSEQALARLAVEMHGGEGLSVLVGGLGLGYSAQAALEFAQVARVEVLELLPQVIAWLTDGLIPLAGPLTEDRRLTVTQADVYARLLGPPEESHDLILIDVDHSPDDRLGAGSAAFYTPDGLTRVKRHLAPNGVLGVWSYAESSDFADALRSVFGEVRSEAVPFRNDLLDKDYTDWLFFARDPGTPG